MARPPKLYAYNPETYEFTGVTEPDPSPLEPGVWLYPAQTTDKEPPGRMAGHAVVWDPNGLDWVQVVDHRGEIWWTPEGNSRLIMSLGDPVAYGYQPQPPAPPADPEPEEPEEPEPLPETSEQARLRKIAEIVAERDRRLALGFYYDFKDARGVHLIGTTAEDRAGWDEVTQASQALILLGMPDAPIGISTDTGPVQVTALEWQKILLRAAEVRQPLWQASFFLQALSEFPEDVTDDSFWPASGASLPAVSTAEE